MAKNGENSNEYLESKERKIEVNEWRKLINIVLIIGRVVLLEYYKIQDKAGFFIWILILLVSAFVIDWVVRKMFSLLMK